MGSVVTVWSPVRLFHYQPIFGVYDSLGRLFFSIAMLRFIFASSDPVHIYFMCVVVSLESAWSIVQLYFYWR